LFAILYEFRFFSEILEKLIFFVFSDEKETPEFSFSKIVRSAAGESDSRFFYFADFHLRFSKSERNGVRAAGNFRPDFIPKFERFKKIISLGVKNE